MRITNAFPNDLNEFPVDNQNGINKPIRRVLKPTRWILDDRRWTIDDRWYQIKLFHEIQPWDALVLVHLYIYFFFCFGKSQPQCSYHNFWDKTRNACVEEPREAKRKGPTDKKQTNNKTKQKEKTTTTQARKRKFGGVRIHTPENLTHTILRA